MMDAKTRRTWISVAVALLVILVVLGLGALGTAIYVFRQHVRTEFVSTESAQDEFQRTRQRFAGQTALIEMHGEGGRPLIHRRTVASTQDLQAVRVLAFDPRAQKLVRVSIPFWLLRLAPSKNFTLLRNDGIDFDTERAHITLDDLERAGPGLILDTQNPRNGTLVIVWTE